MELLMCAVSNWLKFNIKRSKEELKMRTLITVSFVTMFLAMTILLRLGGSRSQFDSIFHV